MMFGFHLIDQDLEAAREMATNRLKDHKLWIKNGCNYTGPQSPYFSTRTYQQLLNDNQTESALTRGMES